MGTRLPVISIVLGIVGLTLLAGCGGGDSSTSSPAGGSVAGGGAAVDLSDNSSLGQILVDGSGRTLYLFEKDASGDRSTCNGACATAWPPYTVKGQPQAGSGVDAAKLATLERKDGTTQVVYDHHPLYHFSGDPAPGDVNGNGSDAFGAKWYALTPAGDAAAASGGGGGTTSTDSSGGGYGY